jgi:UDP-2,4-diacetamido-2,4,6-trideoxy-beta-L-altropyranose hydrolase
MNWLENRSELFRLIKGSNMVIIDSYLADIRMYQRIMEKVKVSVYLDDYQRLNYPPGVLVNPAVMKEEAILYPKENKLLLGSEFFMLRKEFWDIPEKVTREKIENIMVTFGGDDIANATPKVLKMLAEKYPDIKKTVIIGKGFKNTDEIKNSADNNTELVFYPDARKMLEIMLKSDVAVSAAGQTLFELARVGVPTVAVMVAANQTNNIIALDIPGFIDDAGFWISRPATGNIAGLLEKMEVRLYRENKAAIGRKYVDGQGSKRVINYLYENYFSDKQ